MARWGIKQRARGLLVRAIFAFLRRYYLGRTVDMETQKAIQSGKITGSRIEWSPKTPVPTDLTLFWVPEGGTISDVHQVSYARLKSVPGAPKDMAAWRFYE